MRQLPPVGSYKDMQAELQRLLGGAATNAPPANNGSSGGSMGSTGLVPTFQGNGKSWSQGWQKFSPGLEGAIGNHMQNAFDSFGSKADSIGGQIGSVLQGNAQRVSENRARLDDATSRMGLLPFSLAPADDGHSDSDGLSTSFQKYLNMNKAVQGMQAESPMFKARQDVTNRLLAALFPSMDGGGGGGAMPARTTSFSTNFGAGGGFV